MSGEADLYRFLAGLPDRRLPTQTVESCLALVLDHFGCALLGLRMPWTRAVEEVAVAGAGPGSAPIYGGRALLTPAEAALVNGTAGHGFDLDDLYFPAMTHPGCVVIAAAAAAAAGRSVDGRRVLAGIVAGYEVMCRIGVAVGLAHGEAGFHATGQHGPAGAAAAVAVLRGYDASAIASAIGVAGSLGAGIKAFTNGPGMVKRLHAGRAAQAGVLAAELVQHGFAGPGSALTGKFGLVHVLGQDSADPTVLWANLGDGYAVDDVYIKPYPACGAVHGALRATEELVPQLPNTGQIERVVVGTSRRALDQNSDRRPADLMSVQYSMEACVSLGLLGHAAEPMSYLAFVEDENHPARTLAGLVAMELDDKAEAAYPDPNVSRVDVHIKGGRTLSACGSADRSASSGWEVAVEKFNSVTESILTPAAGTDVIAATRRLADGGDLDDCLNAMTNTSF